MSIEQRVHESLSGRQVQKHESYPAFVAELVQYVGMMQGVHVPERDPEMEKVRETIRKLSRQLRDLPEHRRTCWWPHPDKTGGQREWVGATIRVGKELESTARGRTRPQQLAPALQRVAALWKEHFGKSPALGEHSPFLPLFCEVLPQFVVDRKTAAKLLE